MPRTTINLDSSVLRELKARSESERRSLGDLASELLAASLRSADDARARAARFVLPSYDMGSPNIDLNDKEALWRALDDERNR